MTAAIVSNEVLARIPRPATFINLVLMTTRLLFPAIFLPLTLSLSAADGPDFSSFKTADEFWKHIEKLQEQPTEQPLSQDQARQMVLDWVEKQQIAADAFVKAYPTDQ